MGAIYSLAPIFGQWFLTWVFGVGVAGSVVVRNMDNCVTCLVGSSRNLGVLINRLTNSNTRVA